ncbi:UDP-N-acetylglucosamine--N-acetylmuramyl-(pentapeptide) pyrophosphoryl-undecaprenol N-acetylglucosamine transferase [Pyrofollis japonicus]|uniref:UDP-N-acetylglucosamine--N-acetylmuramyl- (pentapeptide) pyrophosphoryl-undecaprenol N-acetylglucosamine transferase n=1 Tax=Pyrofollis japonicus TaxID=3060460 RepID=UPI00295B0AEE|nr:glycosyltransferase [Pyrofollis japonicus]
MKREEISMRDKAGSRVLLTAAPGGHSGYAAAIAHYLREQHGVEPVFIVAEHDEWTPQKLSRLGQTIRVPMPRRPGEPLFKTLHRWPRAFLRALSIVDKDYRVLVSCGANLSVAPALVAKAKGLRLVNVESIVRLVEPGRTPKLLHRFADETLVHWPEQAKLLPGARVVGPIYEPPRYKPRDEGYILVTAGTMGHRELFDAVSELGLRNIVLQTGRVDPEPYRRKHPNWIVFRYDPDLDKWIAGASIVITHFPGMTSATAALAYQKPVVLVASRHLILSASQKNAPLYAEKIGAVYVDEVTPKNIEKAIERAEKIKPKKHPNGAENAAKIIAEMLKESR